MKTLLCFILERVNDVVKDPHFLLYSNQFFIEKNETNYNNLVLFLNIFFHQEMKVKNKQAKLSLLFTDDKNVVVYNSNSVNTFSLYMSGSIPYNNIYQIKSAEKKKDNIVKRQKGKMSFVNYTKKTSTGNMLGSYTASCVSCPYGSCYDNAGVACDKCLCVSYIGGSECVCASS
jgi:hypothetical protein